MTHDLEVHWEHQGNSKLFASKPQTQSSTIWLMNDDFGVIKQFREKQAQRAIYPPGGLVEVAEGGMQRFASW